MDQQIIFKNKLDELTQLAAVQSGVLRKEQIEQALGDVLESEQLTLVYQYLEQQKILIEGWSQTTKERLAGRRKLNLEGSDETAEGADTAGAAEEEGRVEQIRRSLWPEETRSSEAENGHMPTEEDGAEEAGPSALEVYLNELAQLAASEGSDKLALVRRAAAGDEKALEKAAESYLSMVCDLAGEYEKDAAIPVEDLVQEGNIALWMALRELKEVDSLAAVEAQLMNAVNTRMEEAIQEEMDEADSDQAMARKADRLHQAIRSLEEDLGHQVSVDELSAFLEMPAEEINDVLRLTGDLLTDPSDPSETV